MRQLVFRCAGVQDVITTDLDDATVDRLATTGHLQALGIDRQEDGTAPNSYERDLSGASMKSFTPRMHDNGRGICCSHPQNLCAKCKAHFGAAHAEDTYAPPNSYEAGLKQLRAASEP